MTKNAVPTTWNSLTPFDGRLYSDPENVPVQIPVLVIDNPVTSPAGAMVRIYPLNATEITALASIGSANWYQSKWAAGIPWILPLGVRSGTYPYNIALEGPVGAEIIYAGRDTLVPPFWEYISWTNPTVGTHVFNLTWVDQLGDSVTATFTLIVYAATDTNHFMFVNPGQVGASNTNPGTRASAKADFNGWYGGSLASATHRDKIIYYEDDGSTGLNIGGVTGCSYSGSNSQRLRMTLNKPKVHHVISAMNLSGNGAYFQFDSGQGFTFSGPWQHGDANVPEGGGANTRTQFFSGSDAATQYGFVGLGYTALGPDGAPSQSSNSSFFDFATTLSLAPSTFEGFFFPNVILDGILGGPDGIAGLKNYNAMGVLCAAWTVKNCTGMIVFHHKGGDIRRTEMRGCLAIENNTTCQFQVVEWINDPVARYDNHYCWNNIKMVNAARGGGDQLNGGAPDNFARQGGWRNNERINFHWADCDSGVATWTRNARIHAGTYTNGVQISGTQTVQDGTSSPYSEYVSTTTTQFDATTNLLTGATRTAQLGLVGCEMTEVP